MCVCVCGSAHVRAHVCCGLPALPVGVERHVRAALYGSSVQADKLMVVAELQEEYRPVYSQQQHEGLEHT